MRDLSNVKEKHPEVARLEYQLITELAKMNDEISIRLDPKKRGKGRPNKDKNKPKGLDTLQSFNELKAITDKLNDEERQKTADVIGKAVHAFKKGEDPIPQVTEDLKQLMKKKA